MNYKFLKIDLFNVFHAREINIGGTSDEFEFFSLNRTDLEIGSGEISARLTNQHS